MRPSELARATLNRLYQWLGVERYVAARHLLDLTFSAAAERCAPRSRRSRFVVRHDRLSRSDTRVDPERVMSYRNVLLPLGHRALRPVIDAWIIRRCAVIPSEGAIAGKATGT
jgi:hypothetical protein